MVLIQVLVTHLVKQLVWAEKKHPLKGKTMLWVQHFQGHPCVKITKNLNHHHKPYQVSAWTLIFIILGGVLKLFQPIHVTMSWIVDPHDYDVVMDEKKMKKRYHLTDLFNSFWSFCLLRPCLAVWAVAVRRSWAPISHSQEVHPFSWHTPVRASILVDVGH